MKKLFTLIAIEAALLAGSVACGKKSETTDEKGGSTTVVAKPTNPTKVCHLLICCRSMNKGTKFLVNNEWKAAHDYRDIEQTRSILQDIKAAGITVVSVDFTNPPEWDGADNGKIHLDGQQQESDGESVAHGKESFIVFANIKQKDSNPIGLSGPLFR